MTAASVRPVGGDDWPPRAERPRHAIVRRSLFAQPGAYARCAFACLPSSRNFDAGA